eukprot:TRINITY_DN19977_c0_g1_i1.p1 TRINITY_DN19977_c0_g1~~TRINITY_DN19977_c0_g1_i1.p1  ORF type:complete len:329 (+),score=55.52 TRINITY_DN19977_c0_g1_i1:202-1188(+)
MQSLHSSGNSLEQSAPSQFPFVVWPTVVSSFLLPLWLWNWWVSKWTVIAIIASVVVGSLTHYMLDALGPAPLPARLIQRLPKKRWWCASCCGGFNDALPQLGLCLSKKEHRLQLSDLRIAFMLVSTFIWVFILLSSWQTASSMVVLGYEKVDGWCRAKTLLEGTSTNTTITILAITSTLVGGAGLSIIANGVTMALGEDRDDIEKRCNIAAKAGAGSIYLNLPLLKVLIGLIPWTYEAPTVSVAVTTAHERGPDGSWTTSGTTLECPIYDKEVMVPLIYCTLVCLLMAYTTFTNGRLYREHDWEQTQAEEALLQVEVGNSEETSDDSD